jgi:hypothetical protein
MKYPPKKVQAKLEQVTKAWETLRPAKTFAGITLEQFKAKIQPALEARGTIQNLEQQMQLAISVRDEADRTVLSLINLVVNAVKGDVEEGDDGALYEAMGYIRKSNRKSGLHRKVVPLTEAEAAKAA